MPTYAYECAQCGDRFEIVQPITADALTVHEGCGGAVRRLLFPVGIVFKGSGFYVNDYGSKGGTARSSTKPDASAPSAEVSTSSSETKPEPAPAAAPSK